MRPSEILRIEQSALAVDLDLSAAREVLKYENKRDLARLESLIKSLGVMATGLLGGDVQRLIARLQAQEQGGPEQDLDPDDDPNML